MKSCPLGHPHLNFRTIDPSGSGPYHPIRTQTDLWAPSPAVSQAKIGRDAVFQMERCAFSKSIAPLRETKTSRWTQVSQLLRQPNGSGISNPIDTFRAQLIGKV